MAKKDTTDKVTLKDTGETFSMSLPETKSQEHINIGNASFHIESVQAMSKEEFLAKYKGQVLFDLSEVYDKIKKL